MKSKYIFYILFAILAVTILYIYLAPYLILPAIVGRHESKKEQSDFFFPIPEMNLGITTSKRIGAKFYVMFSKENGMSMLSDSIDYVEFETSDMGDINIIFDPKNKNDIYIRESHYLKKVNPVNFNLQALANTKYDSLFFWNGYRTDPDTLKSPYIYLSIISSTYTIFLNLDSINQVRIKEGDIHGGWND